MECDESDMWYVVHRLRLMFNPKNFMLKKICKYNSYKQCFDTIEEAWEETHYMDDDYMEQAQSTNEINKIQECDETTLDDQQEYAFQAEVNEIYQKYGRQYPGNQFR